MTVGKRAKSDQRLPQDKATEYARDDKAPDLEGAGGPQDSEVIQSAVAALGASTVGAGVVQKEELERARKRGMQRDMNNDRPDGGINDDGPHIRSSDRDANDMDAKDRDAKDRDAKDRDLIPGVSGRVAGREVPAQPTRSADELQRGYREGRPGEASARQADPDAAPTPLQRLEEDGDLN